MYLKRHLLFGTSFSLFESFLLPSQYTYLILSPKLVYIYFLTGLPIGLFMQSIKCQDHTTFLQENDGTISVNTVYSFFYVSVGFYLRIKSSDYHLSLSVGNYSKD